MEIMLRNGVARAEIKNPNDANPHGAKRFESTLFFSSKFTGRVNLIYYSK
jgi:hypothetical protein